MSALYNCKWLSYLSKRLVKLLIVMGKTKHAMVSVSGHRFRLLQCCILTGRQNFLSRTLNLGRE